LHVEQLDITDDLIGDYFNDEKFKVNFQTWLNNLWLEKDQLLAKFKGQA
jgi:hypothetical protein